MSNFGYQVSGFGAGSNAIKDKYGGYSASKFDGATQYLNRGAQLDNISDSQLCTFICIVQPELAKGTDRVLRLNNSKMVAGFQIGSRFGISFQNSVGTTIFNWQSTIIPQDGSYHHIAFSVDMSDPVNTGQIYLNGIADTGISKLNTDGGTINFTETDCGIAADPTGTNKYYGAVSELYLIAGARVDFSVEENLRKVISPEGRPIDLGLDGSLLTGTIPQIYMPSVDGVNLGNGGQFTVNGTLGTPWHVPNDGKYVAGSIYSGTKTIDSTWRVEPLASGVNCVEVIVSAAADTVDVGWGNTEAEAKSTIHTIRTDPIELTVARLKTTGKFVAWKSPTAGTIELEQSVIKW